MVPAGRPMITPTPLGSPRRHYRSTDSTNVRASALADAGAPHGTLVTAAEQSAGRGRQGRVWSAPPGSSLLCSVVLRNPGRLVPLAAGVAVAETVDAGLALGAGGPVAMIKWPNDVLVDSRKIAGILVEGRPQDRWAVLGIGLNVAVDVDDLPPELHGTAATLGLDAAWLETVLAILLDRLTVWTAASDEDVLAAVRRRDALLCRTIRWSGGEGTGAGIDADGRLLVDTAPDGTGGRAAQVALDSGEVHLTLT
jgi:BirA family biotin operon repressor/biotin-[acetyl-CoA-carboxylase] ligase